MTSYSSIRFFVNPFPTPLKLLDSSPKVDHEEAVKELLLSLHNGLADEKREAYLSHNYTLYTGLGGITFTYWELYRRSGKSEYLKRAKDLLEPCLQWLLSCDRHRSDVSTFFCGDIGILVTAICVSCAQGLTHKSVRYFDLLQARGWKIKSLRENCDELLYGRAGYLYALFYICRHTFFSLPSELVQRLISQILANAEFSSEFGSIWYWHGKPYLGAAHGTAGILHVLWHAYPILECAQKDFIQKSTLSLCRACTQRAGLPNCAESGSKNLLVHFCHGAPGAILLFCTAYRYFPFKEYLETAETLASVVWEYGLLRKGGGLCHGVAGNAYSFLALYRTTQKLCYLHAATHFAYVMRHSHAWAESCSAYDDPQRLKRGQADHKLSLMEGEAGSALFFSDMNNPMNSAFPGVELAC